MGVIGLALKIIVISTFILVATAVIAFFVYRRKKRSKDIEQKADASSEFRLPWSQPLSYGQGENPQVEPAAVAPKT